MQRRNKDQVRVQQLGLFEAPEARPSWSQMPLDARKAVTELVAMLLRAGSHRQSRLEQETADE